MQKKTSWRTLGTSPPVRLASWSKLTHCWNWTYHPSSTYIWIYDNQNHQIHNHYQNQQRHYPAASKPSSHLQRRALLDPWLSGKPLGCICTNNSLSIWFWWWWKLNTNNPLTALSKKTFILFVYQLEYHHARVPLPMDLLHTFYLEHLNLAMQPKVFIVTKKNDKTYYQTTLQQQQHVATQKYISGLNPSRELHTTFLNIEPLSGVAFQVIKMRMLLLISWGWQISDISLHPACSGIWSRYA